ncbi:LegC family aminotransferase [Rubricoccus marinus]|uniref:GDP-perosamine synthase n=1 Tax=Rubricoccus marinus TaxID=716817 RepID=A0A259U0T4_9BACT|nr:LegC family aminotransferase [Rubricoccus marinus]OZC03434.1 aminotransferase DegT [Rubricoccus marinus]
MSAAPVQRPASGARGSLAGDVLETLQGVLGSPEAFVPLHEPRFAGNEWEYVKECIDTGWVSSAGKYVDRFEQMLAEVTGARRAVAVVNGTAALHVALRLVGVERGDEVLIPALTFVATANAVAYCGATPHFADSEEATLGMDPDALEDYLAGIAEVRDGACVNRQTGRVIRAAVPMHTFGHPVRLGPLAEVCERYGIALVEDAAESLGSMYRGVHTGRIGRVGTLSFNGNKTITTGGGGALITDDEALADLAKHLTTTAKQPHRWAYHHDHVGYNYRLPNINAALGCAQVEQLDGFLASKRELASRYSEAFAGVKDVQFVEEPPESTSNYWLGALLLARGREDERDAVLAATNDAGIMTRPVWSLMSSLPMYAGSPSMDLSVARGIVRRLINIPSSAFLVSDHA